MNFRSLRNALLVCVSVIVLAQALTMPLAFGQTRSAGAETIVIDTRAQSRPFPHFWEKMFGSGRAVLSLRDSYRSDLREVKKITDFNYVRFHAIFHDEVGFYDEDSKGRPIYNFSYVDQIYDGLLENGIRPFVELSFMPKKLAANPILHPFWYKPSPSPPRDYDRWGDLIYQFTKHIVDRYGVDEVSQWYFEVWNEPNLDFWAGEPKESTYFHLYDVSAQAIKRVSTRLRVGGPSTAQAAWVDRFIKHCVDNKIPVDFASTHVYGNDSAKDVFGTNENIPRTEMVGRSVKKVYDQVKASARPNLPIIWSEYNASYMNEVPVTDSSFMGPWLANNIRQCDGMVDMMSYWTFSDVFEEQGVVKTPFYGGFGLIAAGGIPKASFNAFKLLHSLGTERLMNDSNSVLVTRKTNGSLAIAVWNLFLPEEAGATKTVTLELKGLAGRSRVTIQRVNRDHGSSIAEWEKMGRPAFPSRDQLKKLRTAGQLPAPEVRSLSAGNTALSLTLQPHELALVEISK
jgi:xylan 1,4-beta-xylosidase